MSPLICFRASGWRAQACTRQPLAAYCFTKSRPSPRAAPVIRTVLRRSPSVSAVRQQAAALALPVALLDRCALVVRFLADRECDLELRSALFVEIDLQRHDGTALALDGADQ